MSTTPDQSPRKLTITGTQSAPSKRKQTGPVTAAGKAASSMNAVKTGLHVTGWLDDQEQSEYDTLYTALCEEYKALTPTMLLQIERMACTVIKLRRLQKIEGALFQKARQIANKQFDERPLLPGQNSNEREQAACIAQFAAMPDMDRLSTLQRYQTSLDRQLSKILGEIRILSAPHISAQNLSAPHRTLHNETHNLSVDGEPMNTQ